MKHIGMARLGRDAEVRHLPDGTAVANLSLAVSVYDKTAENNRGTQWIDASMWGNQAESLHQYMVKGSLHCFTLSDLRMEFYDKNDGTTGVKLVARVDSVELGPKKEGGESSGAPKGNITRPGSAGGAARAPTPASAPAAQKQTGFDDMDDDIPF